MALDPKAIAGLETESVITYSVTLNKADFIQTTSMVTQVFLEKLVYINFLYQLAYVCVAVVMIIFCSSLLVHENGYSITVKRKPVKVVSNEKGGQ